MKADRATKKRISTRAMMLLTGALTITTGFAVTIGVLSWQSGQAQHRLAEEYLQQIARSKAMEVEKSLNHARDVAQSLGQSLIAMPDAGIHDRHALDKLTEYTLRSNPDYLSISVILEKDVFDGRDAEFATQSGQPPEGRYAWFVDSDKAGHYMMHPLTSFLTPGQGDYYLVAQRTRKDFPTEPYSYAYNGVPTLLTSIATPIIDRGKLWGVVTSDISLAALQQRVNEIKPWQGTGYAMLLSSGGKIVSSPDKEQNNQMWKGDKSRLKPDVTEQDDAILGEKSLITWQPVVIGNSSNVWYLGVAAPVSVVMSAARQQLHNAIWMMLASIVLVSLLLGVVFSRIVLRPLGGEPADAAAFALAVADGQLHTRIPLKAGDQSSLFYALHTMQARLIAMVSHIKETSASVRDGAEEIAKGNINLASRTEQQAAALEETAASMEQLTATVKHNAANAHQATTLTENASLTARKGEALVGEVVQTMAQINDSARKIGDITAIINSIAFQTNILALNAAVEAARAGEQGRGFAVVASEVRNLAQRSASAVKDIASLIEESTQRVDSGVSLVRTAGDTMQEITQAVTSVQAIIDEIATASDEQSRGISQVSIAVNEMDSVTQQNAALVQEISTAASAMEDHSAMLAQSVEQFRLEGQPA
ncbi:methyl-accepting chemotaxis protein [Pantoea sp. ACRSB]|uniref:methyl-accepting chemotaxis protein n=1 Tax=Pantoea sp. ACRSB TaxID=2918207 RepID=UPI002892D9C2|nr:methyl-accepting chemotaxis protein [Pantoea sp. ACRSB]MCG7389524.1 methyl-accepting chemotaxis protein [Pantoea sp. ACRSB]